ncbi:uncharacterized protein LOC117639552 [Thrips palmi]|uniref:Small ribosomal subunit protein mS23 n=1 Tax=Thrips palmi TaxID=161013 RepID=A0A6P8XW49_THRPL|nr:uncharacterized protein LOC117639552 [Thrips palmi]
MSVTKNNGLIKLVRKQISGGFEKKESISTPQARFEKLGTIYSRTTGLIKSGVIPSSEIPIWYSLYKTFPPKYEPKYKRPPLEVEVKEIYYPEDKRRASTKQWPVLNLNGTTPAENVEKPQHSVSDLIAEADSL